VQRHAVSEYWRLWLRGEISNAMVIIQHRDGTWRLLCDAHEPDPKPRRRVSAGTGPLRVIEGNPSASRP
jgi:hypothetical protein